MNDTQQEIAAVIASITSAAVAVSYTTQFTVDVELFAYNDSPTLSVKLWSDVKHTEKIAEDYIFINNRSALGKLKRIHEVLSHIAETGNVPQLNIDPLTHHKRLEIHPMVRRSAS